METKMKRAMLSLLFVLAAAQGLQAGWTTPVPLTEVNTAYNETDPFLSFDGLSLYFTRSATSTFYYGRIYVATRANPWEPFTSVREISELNQSGTDVYSPWVSPDNLRMYYGKSPGKVMLSSRASVDDPWSPGVQVSGLTLAGGAYWPKLSQDELTIVFHSTPDSGGMGGTDLWMATRPDRNSVFGNVTDLATINSSAGDGSPSLSPDGLTIYFNSTRDGNQRVYKATRASLAAPFGTVEHLTFLDTPWNWSTAPCISPDGKVFYLTVKIANGTFDIYVSNWESEPNIPGLVAHWAFDEGSGNIAHDSAGSNNGTIYGAAWTDGVLGGALDFDGINDYVQVPDNDLLTPSNTITFAFWVNSRGGQNAMLHKYAYCPDQPSSPGYSRAYQFGLLSTGQIEMQIFSSASTYDVSYGLGSVAFNEWHHVAGTFDHGAVSFYIDGQHDSDDCDVNNE